MSGKNVIEGVLKDTSILIKQQLFGGQKNYMYKTRG